MSLYKPLRFCIALSIVLLSGCTMAPWQEWRALLVPYPPVTLRAVGYGTVRPDKGLTVNQMKLMAIRASNMDAYRHLAEQVHGIQISGTTTIGAMTVVNDSYKGYVNGFLRGAKLISRNPLTDNYTYETILELTLGDDFQEASHNALASSSAPDNTAPSAGGVAFGDRYYYNSH